MRHFVIGLLGLCFSFMSLQAQNRYTISGYVGDQQSGEKLINAQILDRQSRKGVISNTYGFYSLTLPAGPVELVVSYPGYQTFKANFNLQADTTLELSMSFFEVDAVDIVAEEEETIESQTQMSVIDVPIRQIKLLPALLGEVDVVKAIQLLPGVQSGSEASTGLYVRGGGPDQNLITLDGVPLYYVSHLGGFFSVFNADALSSVKLVKGGFPARYGGRLSSVLDVRMKEGNLNKFQGEGSIGLISSKLSFQGPIIKGKSSFIISGRRTYIDLFTRPISKAVSQGNTSFGYFFHDLNGKANYIFSEKDRLYFSFYIGDDRLGVRDKWDSRDNGGDPNDFYSYDSKIRMGWGNDMAALRWNHIWSDKLFSNLTATYSKYGLKIRADENSEQTVADSIQKSRFLLEYVSEIQDWGAKLDFDFYPGPAHDIKFGVNSIYHTFAPGTVGYQEGVPGSPSEVDTTLGAQIDHSWENFVYLEDNIKFGRRISANLGVHAVHYMINNKSTFSIQPRVSARFQVAPNVSLKGSYAIMSQFLHLLTNSGVGLPIDLWVPATENVPGQLSWQAAGGVHASFMDGQLEASVEGYYKEMDGLITYKEGTNFFLGGISQESWENLVETGGQGKAYGAEFLLQKRKGKTTGWVGYTLSWNTRQFDNINGGKPFFYKYDRRHDLSIVLIHQLSERISLSGTWVYGTGNAISIPTGIWGSLPFNGNGWYNQRRVGTFRQLGIDNGWGGPGVELYEDGRNSFRMQHYHRLDLGISLTKPTKWGERTWNFSVYNAYSRLNPFSYYFAQDWDWNTQELSDPKLKKLALFPIIPSVSYAFKF